MQIERAGRLFIGQFQRVALHGFVEKSVQWGDGRTELETVIAIGFERRLIQEQQAGQALQQKYFERQALFAIGGVVFEHALQHRIRVRMLGGKKQPLAQGQPFQPKGFVGHDVIAKHRVLAVCDLEFHIGG